MKLYKIIFLLLIFPIIGKSQNIQASYKVSQDIFASFQDFDKKKIATLESIGYFYKKENHYLYFEKPSYLSDYPTGHVELSEYNLLVGISMDSIQKLNYVSLDSLVRYYRPHMTGKDRVKFNYSQKFELDYFDWEFLPETKDVNGLKCQKAQLKIRDNLQWIVWFAPEIPTQAGIFNITGLPGLVVSAECVPINTRYELVSYTIGTDISEQLFHPKEFNQPFTRMVDLKKGMKSNGGKSKIQKQAELTNQ
jgi:GLPGLI family protein